MPLLPTSRVVNRLVPVRVHGGSRSGTVKEKVGPRAKTIYGTGPDLGRE